ncbi:MAG: hypothetical protein RBU30_07765, partial [Polyangia bacterium]|nr:hypothetical protein [Polyangia bacterium]
HIAGRSLEALGATFRSARLVISVSLISFPFAACFVEGRGELSLVTVSLGLGGVTKGKAIDPDETVDLAEHPCFVGARISATDLPHPVRAAWACEAGEEPGGEVGLDIEVQSGSARELRVVVFLAEPEGLVTLASYSTHDLAAGAVDLSVEVTEVPTGSVDGFVTGADRDVLSARLMDLETGVLLPPLPTTASGGGFHFTTSRLPRGRFFGLYLELAGGTLLEIPDCPVYATEGTVRVLQVDASSGSC